MKFGHVHERQQNNKHCLNQWRTNKQLEYEIHHVKFLYRNAAANLWIPKQ